MGLTPFGATAKAAVSWFPSPAFQVEQLLSLWHFFVERIQWETTRDETFAWRSRAVAEGATNVSSPQRLACQDACRQIVLSQCHPPQPAGIHVVPADGSLPYMRQPILQVRVPRTHENQIWITLLQYRRRVDLPGDATNGSSGDR